MKIKQEDDERRSFFFQAEDGIRDYDVTGVQTCALPICRVISHSIRLVPSIDDTTLDCQVLASPTQQPAGMRQRFTVLQRVGVRVKEVASRRYAFVSNDCEEVAHSQGEPIVGEIYERLRNRQTIQIWVAVAGCQAVEEIGRAHV